MEPLRHLFVRVWTWLRFRKHVSAFVQKQQKDFINPFSNNHLFMSHVPSFCILLSFFSFTSTSSSLSSQMAICSLCYSGAVTLFSWHESSLNSCQVHGFRGQDDICNEYVICTVLDLISHTKGVYCIDKQFVTESCPPSVGKWLQGMTIRYYL